MIPLNKPGYRNGIIEERYIDNHFPGLDTCFLSSAGDGLHVVFNSLYKRFGPLRVGVCPLACTLALEPIVHNGHIPVFLDVNPETFNLDGSLLESKAHTIDALEVIHLGGNPNEMSVISNWAKKYQKIVIEDCAQALGSSYDNLDVGTFGDFACFSLMKNLYAPVGGLLLSKQTFDCDYLPTVPNLLIVYRIIKKFFESKANHCMINPWNWAYSLYLGFKENKASNLGTDHHYRVNSKMEKSLIKRLAYTAYYNSLRQERAQFMIDRINTDFYSIQKEPLNGRSNRNRLLIKVKDADATSLIHFLRHRRIAANNLTQNYMKSSQPHISQDMLLGQYYCSSNLKNYDDVFRSLIAIPCSPFLNKKEMEFIVDSLHAFFQ